MKMEELLFSSKGKHTLHGLNFYLSYFDDIAKVLDRDQLCFIVGGWVRDRVLGIPVGRFIDVDFLVTGDPVRVAKETAERIGGDFFVFEKRGLLIKRPLIATVVLHLNDHRYRFDFSELKGKDTEKALIEDLLDRDFTANAMAVSLDDVLSIGARQTILYDPAGGIADLERGILRPVSLENIKKDPVRILRGYRIAVEKDLQLTEEFEEFSRKEAHLLKKSSPERLTYELFRIIKSSKSAPVMRKLYERGILQVLIPHFDRLREVKDQGERHIYPLDEHTFKTLEFMEKVLEERYRYLPEGFKESIGKRRILGEFTDIELLKWSALLHDIGKPVTFEIREGKVTFYNHDKVGEEIVKEIGNNLRWGKEATQFVAKLVRFHLRPFYLRDSREKGQLKDRGRARFWKDCGDIAPHLFLLSIADSMASGDKEGEIEALLETIRDLDEFKRKVGEESREVPLLSGREIMEILGIPQGPAVGRIKEELLIAQMEGKVKDRESAVDFIKEKFKELEEVKDADTP
jgi:poly(A) polymerase